jgi:hypothetical protein
MIDSRKDSDDAALHLLGIAPREPLPVGQVHSTMDNSLSSGKTSACATKQTNQDSDSFFGCNSRLCTLQNLD